MLDAALTNAASEAAGWLAVAMLVALAAYGARKRSAIDQWRQQRAERRAAFRTMVNSFPELREQVGKIAAQVHPNGGGSLMDAVTRTEHEVKDLRRDVGAVELMVRASSDLATEGEFECDGEGSVVHANLSFARIVGVGRAELERHGWKNFIHSEDAAAFLLVAEQAFAENRTFSGKLRFVRPDGTAIRVDIVVMPFPEAPPSRWFGKVRIIR